MADQKCGLLDRFLLLVYSGLAPFDPRCPFQFLDTLSQAPMFSSVIINIFQCLHLYLSGPSSDGAMIEVLPCLRKHLREKDVINVIQQGGKSYALIDITLFDVTQHPCQDNTLNLP